MTGVFKNFESRMSAVQTLYSYYIQVKDQDMENTYLKTLDTKTSMRIKKQFVLDLVNVAIEKQPEIDAILTPHLTKHESIEELMVLLRTILRLAVAEQMFFDTPYKIVVDEYVRITTMFFDTEVGFVNAILDKVFSKPKE